MVAVQPAAPARPDATAQPADPVSLALLGSGGIGRLGGDAIDRGRLPGVRVVAVAGAGPGSRSGAEHAERLGATRGQPACSTEHGVGGAGSLATSHLPRAAPPAAKCIRSRGKPPHHGKIHP